MQAHLACLEPDQSIRALISRCPPSSKTPTATATQITAKETFMPFVDVKPVESVFTTEQKHEMAKALTDTSRSSLGSRR
jgi:hypothetical protein